MIALHFFAGFPCEVYTDLKTPVLILLSLATLSVYSFTVSRKKSILRTHYSKLAFIAILVLILLLLVSYFSFGCKGRVIMWQ